MKKKLLIASLLVLSACSKDSHIEVEQSGRLNVDKIQLSEDNLLSVDQYLTDDRSRMTVLIQCDQFFSESSEEIPQHCLNAKEAEEKAVFLDVVGAIEKEKGRPLTESEINEIAGTIDVLNEN